MKIKDFKVGQTVYVDCNGNVLTKTVKKVGRKYVYTETDSWEEKFENPYPCDGDAELCLVETKNWGNRKKLYLRKEDIELEKRKNVLVRWLFNSYGGARKHKYTVEQLEDAIKALDPNGEYRDEIENEW